MDVRNVSIPRPTSGRGSPPRPHHQAEGARVLQMSQLRSTECPCGINTLDCTYHRPESTKEITPSPDHWRAIITEPTRLFPNNVLPPSRPQLIWSGTYTDSKGKPWLKEVVKDGYQYSTQFTNSDGEWKVFHHAFGDSLNVTF